MNGRLQWIVGGYYEKSNTLDPFTGSVTQALINCSDLTNLATCALPTGAGSFGISFRNTTFEGFGLFSQATFDITDELSLTAGIRYTEDRSSAIDGGRRATVLPTGALPFVCEKGTLPDCTIAYATKTSAPTWLINLSYQPNENMHFYAKYARGYKQGMVNPRGFAPYNKFGPEQLDVYEAGAKLAWRGAAPGYVNVAAFFNDFAKQQFLVRWFADDILQGTHSAIVNAGRSEGYGVELDGSVTLFDSLNLTGSAAYLHTELKDVFTPPGPPGFSRPNDVLTNRAPAPLAPKWKGTISARYTLPIDAALGDASIAATWIYSASYYSAQGGARADRIDGFDILNLNFDWKNVGGAPIDIGVFANNVADRKYHVFKTNQLGAGYVSSQTGLPRTYGVQVKYHFGADGQ
jgi:iron complex outermembrane receptor protein